MEKDKKVKDMTIYEASDFWDEHDFSEFNDVVEVKDVRFSFSKKKYIGIDIGVYNKVRQEAQRLHKTEGILIGEWLREKMSNVKG